MNITGSGVNYDDSGFLVGRRRLEQTVKSVEQDTKEIIRLLEAQLQARAAHPPEHQLSNFQKTIIEANRRATVEAVDLIIKSNHQQTRIRANPRPTIDSDSIRPQPAPRPDTAPAATGTAQPTPSRSRFPTRRTMDTDNPADMRELREQQQRRNASTQQRDARGRFGNGSSSNTQEASTLNKISDRIKDGFKDIHTPQGVDPTVDAVNELGSVLKPAGALFRNGKRNEPLSRQEEKHNREEIRLLQRIAGNNGSGGNGGMLAMLRFLPLMIGAIVAAIGAAAAAAFGMGGGDAINEQLGKTETGRKIQDTFGKVTARTLAWFGNKDAQEAVAANDKAEDAERYKNRPENPAWYSNDGVKRFARKFGIDGWLKEDEPVAGKPASDGKAVDRLAGGVMPEFKGGNIASLNEEETLAFARRVISRENKSGKLDTVNPFGYTGKYQFGASALAETGFIDKDKLAKMGKGVKNGSDAKAHKAFLADKSNWIKGNWEIYKSSAEMQDESFRKLTESNIEQGINIHKGDKSKMLGFAMAAHLKGASNAKKWYGQGIDSKDGNGTRTSDYAKYGEGTLGSFKQAMPKTPEELAKFAQGAEVPQNTSYNRLNTNPAKPTRKAAVIPLAPTTARSAPQLTSLPPVPSVKESLISKQPQIVQLASSSDNISQNVADRDIAHSVTGGLGARNWEV